MCHSVRYCIVNWTEYGRERGSTTGNAKLDMHTYIYTYMHTTYIYVNAYIHNACSKMYTVIQSCIYTIYNT